MLVILNLNFHSYVLWEWYPISTLLKVYKIVYNTKMTSKTFYLVSTHPSTDGGNLFWCTFPSKKDQLYCTYFALVQLKEERCCDPNHLKKTLLRTYKTFESYFMKKINIKLGSNRSNKLFRLFTKLFYQ